MRRPVRRYNSGTGAAGAGGAAAVPAAASAGIASYLGGGAPAVGIPPIPGAGAPAVGAPAVPGAGVPPINNGISYQQNVPQYTQFRKDPVVDAVNAEAVAPAATDNGSSQRQLTDTYRNTGTAGDLNANMSDNEYNRTWGANMAEQQRDVDGNPLAPFINNSLLGTGYNLITGNNLVSEGNPYGQSTGIGIDQQGFTADQLIAPGGPGSVPNAPGGERMVNDSWFSRYTGNAGKTVQQAELDNKIALGESMGYSQHGDDSYQLADERARDLNPDGTIKSNVFTDLMGTAGQDWNAIDQQRQADQGGTTLGASNTDRDAARSLGFDSVYDYHEATQGGGAANERKDQANIQATQDKVAAVGGAENIPNLRGRDAAAWLSENGFGNYDRRDAADAIAGLRQQNDGGPIYRNNGGPTEEDQRVKVARSQLQVAPPPARPAGGPIGPEVQKGGGGIASQLGKEALTSALGPLGGIVGGLFNDGGSIPMQHLNAGGWLSALFGGGDDEKPARRSRPLPEGYKQTGSKRYRESDTPRRISYRGDNPNPHGERLKNKLNAVSQSFNESRPLGFNTGGPLMLNQGGRSSRPLPEGYKQSGSKLYRGGKKQDKWSMSKENPHGKRLGTQGRLPYKATGIGEFVRNLFKNDGGPIGGQMSGPLGNPQGYNAGGMVQETPIKKVMDEDKIAMAREAFDLSEMRKDNKAQAEELRAQESHEQAMKMKKKAAVTKTAPLASR